MDLTIIFVTGATGFIGSHVVDAALKAGFGVRVSVRKAEQVQDIQTRHTLYSEQLDVVVIPDLSDLSTVESALAGVTYVFHLASPMPGKGSDARKDYVDPAVNYTETILRASEQHKTIKRVIVMSSILALLPVDALARTEVSAEANTGRTIPVDLNMQFPDGFIGHALKYSASKILAHEHCKAFLKQNQPHYNLVTFHPSFVLGESLVQKSAQGISGMNALLWMSLFSEKPLIPPIWVSVKDVAEAHIKALDPSFESGTEFLLSAPPFKWDEIVDFVNQQYPRLGCQLQPPFQVAWHADTSLADKELGIHWKSKESMVVEVVNQQLALKAG